MAQVQPGETQESAVDRDPNGASFKFNAQAPEFVPRAQTQHVPVPGYYYPYVHFLGGGNDCIYIGDQEPLHLIAGPSIAFTTCLKNVLTNDLRLRIVRQAEYQLSDMSLLANDSLAKNMNKDPEGYVPLSVIACSKKIKSLTSSNQQLLVQALLSSSKLIVSDDHKKVKRKYLFTDRDKEDLQSRTVLVENLPQDHSHQNLEKIFSVVGSVKTVRVWHPQESNTSRPKSDNIISNQLHALVEYETTEVAEKAVEKLNDERNWRKGLRVRLLLRRSPKSVLKSRKSDFDGFLDDDDTAESWEDSSQPYNIDTESNAEENSETSRKGWARGHGNSRGRTKSHIGHGLLAAVPQLGCSTSSQCERSSKQVTKGPKMPDGTRGFTIGRGRPVCAPAPVSFPLE